MQQDLVHQSASHGHSVSSRRPAGLSKEQSAALNSHPILLRIQEQVNKLPRLDREDGRRHYNKVRARLYRERKTQIRETWTVQQAVEVERNIRGETISNSNRTRSSRPMGAAQRYVAVYMVPSIPFRRSIMSSGPGKGTCDSGPLGHTVAPGSSCCHLERDWNKLLSVISV